MAALLHVRWTRRGLGALALTTAAAGALAQPRAALAHANLVDMAPPAGPIDALPNQLALTFSEALYRGSTAALLDVNGSPVDGVGSQIDPANQARLLVSVPPLPPAPYTVGWTSISADDGHEESSFYALLVGGAMPPVGVQPPLRQPVSPLPDLDVTLLVAPDASGVMQWAANVAGPTANLVQRVMLRFMSPVPNQGVAQAICDQDPVSSVYVAGYPMALAGDWQIDTIVRRLNVADDLHVPFVWTAAVTN